MFATSLYIRAIYAFDVKTIPISWTRLCFANQKELKLQHFRWKTLYIEIFKDNLICHTCKKSVRTDEYFATFTRS